MPGMTHRIARRRFLSLAGAGAAAQFAMAQDHEGTPVNFLVILFDKCRRDAIGAYGRKDVYTPNMDRLAAGGVRFDNCYSPQPLCAPCRASIITGKYPHAHRMQKNTYPYVPNGATNLYHEPIPGPFTDPRFDLWENFPHFLNNAGYRTAQIGKWHLGEGNPGFFDVWKGFNSQLLHWLGEPHKSPYRPTVQTGLGVEFIEENAHRPFLLYESYYSPHEPNDPPKRFLDPYRGRNVAHADYYASVAALDVEIGRLVAALERKKILDNTFIILTTEHGRTWEDRPGTLAGMSISYDDAARIPLIMHCPKLLPKGVVWNSGVSSVDIMPTVMHAAGLYGRGRTDYSTRSLLPDIGAGRDQWRRTIVVQNISQKGIDGIQFEERALRTERWKLILRDFAAHPPMRADELYDMRDDPEERKNLYAARPDIVKDLAAKLAAWGDEQEDRLAVKLGRRSAGN